MSTRDMILNINDNDANLYIVSRVLKGAGFEVIEASTGMDGLRLASEQLPSLIVLDIKLPDLDGYEVCRLLKQDPRTSPIPVLHLTGHETTVASHVKSIEKGAEAYLTFPIEASFLLATVRSLLKWRASEEEKAEILLREQAERKRLEQALKDLESERGIRDQFIAILTHDLRSPLTAIKMTAQLMARGTASDEAAVSMAARIISSANRADKMIQDLLDVSSLRVGQKLPLKPVRCDLGELIDEIREEFAVTQGERIRVRQSEGPIPAELDPTMLRRAIDNLIQNAIKYGSPVAEITVALKADADTITIQVHNFGEPIPESAQETLFDQFKRSPGARSSGKQGWGLGLTLVRGVAEAHRGSVLVDSSREKGTSFTLRLPRFFHGKDRVDDGRAAAPARDLETEKGEGK